MGETAADTRQEIEQTRRQLGVTVAALRERTVVVRGRVVRVVVIAGSAAAGLAGVGVITLLVLRRRRGGPITRAVKHLPPVTRDAAVVAARTSDRWLARRADRIRKQREEIIEDLSARIAQNQADAQRRANPLWRRAAGTALETAASAGVSALVQRAIISPMRRPVDASSQLPADQTELSGIKQSEVGSDSRPASMASVERA